MKQQFLLLVILSFIPLFSNDDIGSMLENFRKESELHHITEEDNAGYATIYSREDLDRMRAYTLKDGLTFRYGGEEFLLLLKKNNSALLLEKLLKTIRNHTISMNKETIKYTISMGVNDELTKYKNFTDMIKAADIALYNAKIGGRDRIVYYTEG